MNESKYSQKTPGLARWGIPAGILLAVGLIVSVIRGKFQPFFEGYYFAFLFTAGIPVGALGIRLIHSLTNGRWGNPLQKYCIAITRIFPFVFLIWLPQAFWLKRIYVWTDSQYMHADPALASKLAYLNIPFFIIRTALYFIVWTGITWWLDHRNQKKDLSGMLMVIYAIIGSFAGIDWMMSLDPKWFSTIFGLLFMTGQVLLTFSSLVAVHIFLEKPDHTDTAIATRLRDMGNMMLMMIMLWAYLAFSQFLIIWMGNLPEEISWYLLRDRHIWGDIAWFIIVAHFFIPFFMLLRRAWKMNRNILAGIAVWIFFMRIVFAGRIVFPGLKIGTTGLTFIHLLVAVGIMGIYSLWLLNRCVEVRYNE